MDTGSADRHHNIIDGAASLSGFTVQAGEVSGGIHAHVPDRRRPVPRQLPPDSRHFTDREEDIAVLEALRTDGTAFAPRLIAVTGPAGVGKTALAVRWLRERAADFPDGQFYADLRGHLPASAAAPGEVLGQFLRAMDQPAPVELAEQAALWRSVTAGLRVSVLLDNAFTAAQVRPLLPAGPGSFVIVTSRQRLTGLGMDGAGFHTVEHLGPEAATELLTHGIGEERLGKDTAAARRIVALCAGLPLALCLVSARLAARPRQPVRSMAEALSSERRRLNALEVEGERTVRATLDESYAGLSPEAAGLYRGLGLLPLLGFDARTAAAVCEVPLPEAAERLDVLLDANLLEEQGTDSYRFHDLVRLHAAERGAADEPEAARAATVRRVFDAHLAVVAEAERLLAPARRPMARDHAAPPELAAGFADAAEALAWLDARRFNLMSLVRDAAERQWDDAVWQLVDALWPLFLRLRHYDLWIEAHQLGLAAARRAGNAAAERQMLTSGAAGLSSARRLTDAAEWYRLSLESARASGARRPEGQALLGLGACMFESGRGAEGIPYLREAITVWEGIDYVRGAALARIVLGEIALGQGDAARAVEYFAHAHATLRTVDDPHDEARALAFLGLAHQRSGDTATGVAELERALAEFTTAGSAHWQGRALEMLGQGAEERAEPETARERYERALAVWAPISQADAERIRRRLAALAAPE